MIIFLLVFLFLYGSGHAYLLVKVRAAYGLGHRANLLLSLCLLVMVLAPLWVRWLVQAGFSDLARPAAFLAYGWMGLLFYMVFFGLLLDGFTFLGQRLAVRLCRCNFPDWWSARHLFFVSIMLSLVLVGYGFFEARCLRIERVVVPTSKLSSGIERLKIVQVSDLHLGLLVGQERLRAVVEAVQRLEPDILVATGDLVDGQGNDFAELARLFREIRVTRGKFAILGNHEFYAGLSHSVAFLEQAGFVVLRNEARQVAGGLVVAGVDDRRGATWPMGKVGGEAQLMAGLSQRDRFVLLLKHRPQVESASLGHFDLQLSGHVHQGQFFPFGWVVRWFYPVPVGVLQSLAEGYLYVSRGAGTWGPPIRVLAPPEVTLIELVAAPAVAR